MHTIEQLEAWLEAGRAKVREEFAALPYRHLPTYADVETAVMTALRHLVSTRPEDMEVPAKPAAEDPPVDPPAA